MGKDDLTLLIDVGGTKTRFTLIDSDGKTQKTKTIPSASDRLPQQTCTFLKNIKSRPAGLKAGLRGVWTDKEKAVWKKKLKGLAGSVHITSDVELAHDLFFHGGPGILLIGGTGSIAFGRAPNGKTARAGGLGPWRGDEGSGFWIGHQTKKKRRLSKSDRAVSQTAALAKNLVEKAAQGSNQKTQRIVKEAQVHLASLIHQVRRKLGLNKKVPLRCEGGLFKNAWFKKGVLRAVSVW